MGFLLDLRILWAQRMENMHLENARHFEREADKEFQKHIFHRNLAKMLETEKLVGKGEAAP